MGLTERRSLREEEENQASLFPLSPYVFLPLPFHTHPSLPISSSLPPSPSLTHFWSSLMKAKTNSQRKISFWLHSILSQRMIWWTSIERSLRTAPFFKLRYEIWNWMWLFKMTRASHIRCLYFSKKQKQTYFHEQFQISKQLGW